MTDLLRYSLAVTHSEEYGHVKISCTTTHGDAVEDIIPEEYFEDIILEEEKRARAR